MEESADEHWEEKKLYLIPLSMPWRLGLGREPFVGRSVVRIVRGLGFMVKSVFRYKRLRLSQMESSLCIRMTVVPGAGRS